MPLTHCDVLRMLWRSIKAMGCFFGCFRIRDHRRRSNPHLLSNSRESAFTQNPLSSLFQSEEEERKEFDVKDRTNLIQRSGSPGDDDRELRDEAKFLKACGVLPETPAEIRKTSKLKESPHGSPDSEASKFHSWLPNTSISKLLYKDKEFEGTPSKFKDELETRTSPLRDSSPSSCIIDEENDVSITVSSPGGEVVNSSKTVINPQGDGASSTAISSLSAGSFTVKSQRNKSVRFKAEPVPSESSPEITSHNSEKTDSAASHHSLKPSPAPTPLKLTEDMQTPGTEFATNLENLPDGKKFRITSQYAYLKTSKDEGVSSDQKLASTGEAFDHCTPNPKMSSGENSVKNELNVDLSLSAWLKPPPSKGDVNENPGAARFRRAHAGNHHIDRPILGMVAAHWKEDEERLRISPKKCGGNGIPNSTTKYKEDQKVSWHATPFEERLEKALSEEGVIPQRKPMTGTSIAFEDHETDTLQSSFQSLSNPQSLVSF